MTFSKTEKSNIQKRLIDNCIESWSIVGYKKTKISELCTKSGISKGSFYNFYESKESLFLDVLLRIQSSLVSLLEENLAHKPNKEGLVAALIDIYEKYIEIPFIFETQTPDFIMFMNKLSVSRQEELQYHQTNDLKNVINDSGLRFKISEERALAMVGFIFSPLPKEKRLFLNKLGTIEDLIKITVDYILE